MLITTGVVVIEMYEPCQQLLLSCGQLGEDGTPRTLFVTPELQHRRWKLLNTLGSERDINHIDASPEWSVVIQHTLFPVFLVHRLTYVECHDFGQNLDNLEANSAFLGCDVVRRSSAISGFSQEWRELLRANSEGALEEQPLGDTRSCLLCIAYMPKCISDVGRYSYIVTNSIITIPCGRSL
jgi:hypothetical protein